MIKNIADSYMYFGRGPGGVGWQSTTDPYMIASLKKKQAEHQAWFEAKRREYRDELRSCSDADIYNKAVSALSEQGYYEIAEELSERLGL